MKGSLMDVAKLRALFSGDRRPVAFVVGGLLLAVAAVAGYVLFFTGSGADPLAGAVVVPGQGQSHATPNGVVTVVPVALAGTRDPFNADGIVVSPSAAPSSSTASATPSPTTSASATGTPFVFKLLDLTATTATVLVNGHPYSPTVGSSFATYFKLYAIFGTNCAGFQYQTQNLALCKGDSTVLTP